MKNILILKIGALGDVVRTTYILPGLKEKYKESKIYWITSKKAEDLLKFNKYIDKLVMIEDEEQLSKLKKLKFDLIISLEDEEEIYSKIEDFEVIKIIGVYKKNNKIRYTEELNEWFDMGLISKYGKERADKLKKENKKTHTEIFSKGLDIEIKSPYFFNDEEVEKKVEKKFKEIKKNKVLFGFNLSAGKRWPSKTLRLEEGIKLLKLLKKCLNIQIYILGGKDDLLYNEKLYKEFQNEENIKLIQPCNLNEFSAIIKNLDLLICSDTLALHLGIAQNIKTISYYSSTSAVEIETFGLGEKIISETLDYCSYLPNADNSTITAEKIYEKILKCYKSLEKNGRSMI